MFGFNYGSFGSASPVNNNAVTHDNTFLSPVGEAVGAALGNTIFAPIGGTIWGAPAGKMAGQTLGDIFGGNWRGVQADNQEANAPLQALGLPNMGGSFFGLPAPQGGQGMMGGMGGGMPGMGGGGMMPGLGMPGMGGGLLSGGGNSSMSANPMMGLLSGLAR